MNTETPATGNDIPDQTIRSAVTDLRGRKGRRALAYAIRHMVALAVREALNAGATSKDFEDVRKYVTDAKGDALTSDIRGWVGLDRHPANLVLRALSIGGDLEPAGLGITLREDGTIAKAEAWRVRRDGV